jgi:hypothetical protein
VGKVGDKWGKIKKFGERLGKVCTSGKRWGKVGKVGKGGERWGKGVDTSAKVRKGGEVRSTVFFNRRKAFSTVMQRFCIRLFNRPEVVSTAFQQTHFFNSFQKPQNVFNKISTDPKCFQRFLNRPKVF